MYGIGFSSLTWVVMRVVDKNEVNVSHTTGENLLTVRASLGVSRKEFSDALRLTKEEEKLLRHWEEETLPVPSHVAERVTVFPTEPPFRDRVSGESVRLRVVDLFAGIGGIRQGFEKHGGQVVFSSEWDKFAQKTYRINFGETPHGDITQINENDIPNHDVLVAGFPCQPFSSAGLRKGFEDTRGTLFFDIARILEAKQPKAFMLENVKQLRTHNKGDTLTTIKRVLNSLGYYVPEPEVLNAYHFGVPQHRERIIIVGFLKEKLITNPAPFIYPKGVVDSTVKVGNILETDVPERFTLSDTLYQGHVRRRKAHVLKGNGFGFSLFNTDSKYTNTISARYCKDGSEALIEQGGGKNPRMLTPRECARLQGFPDEFIIAVSNSQAYKQFGNSVAIPMIEAVAGGMVKYLEENEKS